MIHSLPSYDDFVERWLEMALGVMKTQYKGTND